MHTLHVPVRRIAYIAFVLLGCIPPGSTRAADPAAYPEDGLSPRWRRLAKHTQMDDRQSFFKLSLIEQKMADFLRATSGSPAVPQIFAASETDAIPQAIFPDLTVDAASGNSPFPVTSDASYGNVYVGNTTTGVVNQSAGTLTANTSLYVGNNAGSNGAYNLTGGSLAVTGNSYVGYNGTGSFVQNGTSSVTIGNSTTASGLTLGDNASSVGTYSLADSATLKIYSGLGIGINSADANTFTESGGSLTAGSITIGSGNGPFSTVYGTGTFNLSGGTVTVGTISLGTGGIGTSSGTFNLSGGTLNATSSFVVGDTGTGMVNQTGGAVITSQLVLGNTGYRGSFIPAFGGKGTYNLSAGSLSAGSIILGNYDGSLNSGTFVQSGATTVTVTNGISLGVGAGGSGNYSLADTAAVTAATLNVGGRSGPPFSSNAFTQTGGTAKFTTGVYLGYSGGQGAYNLSAGTLTTPVIYSGYASTGSFAQSGNSSVTTTTVHVGSNASSYSPIPSFTSTYSLGDTATLTGATLYVGEATTGANAFTQTGGTANFSSAVYVGYSPSAVGTLSLSGGTLAVGSGGIILGNGGSSSSTVSIGTITLSGGAISTTGSLSVGYQGTGTVNQTSGTFTVGTGGVTMGPVGNYSSGTYNLGGTGTLATPSVNGAAGSTFNFNGGTLQATADSTAFLVGTTNVQAGGAVIDSNGHSITIAQSLAHDNSAMGNNPDGGLKKIGLGKLTLTNQSTITGPVVVNGGTLVLSDSFGAALAKTASLTVNQGGTVALGSSNQLSPNAPVTFNTNSGPGSGASVAFNTGGYNQTLGALTLSSNSVISFGGAAGVLHFADSHLPAWTGTLAIWNWTDTPLTGGGADELIFGSNTASLTNTQLAEIQFYSDSGSTLLAAAGFASSGMGEVVPGGMLMSTVPEPATWLDAALLAGVAGWRVQRRSYRSKV